MPDAMQIVSETFRGCLRNMNNKTVFLLMIFLSQLIFDFNPKQWKKKNFQFIQSIKQKTKQTKEAS